MRNMARKPRTVVTGYPNYIALVSNKGTPIFRDDEDRVNFLTFLKGSRLSTNERIKLYAYVLMDNLVHLIVLPDREEDVSRLIQNLGRRYVRYYNLKHNQSGPLFESRFKNFVIGMDEYLLLSIRYLESRPLKEGIAKTLEGYNWSSYDFRAYGKDVYEILDYDAAYVASGATQAERQENYRNIFSSGIKKEDEALLEQLIYKGGIFADEKTKKYIEESVGFRLTPKKVGRPKKDSTYREELLIKRRYGLKRVLLASALIILDIFIITATLHIANSLTMSLRNFLPVRHQTYIIPYTNYRWLPFMIVFVVEASFFNLGLYTDLAKFTKYEIFLRVGKAILLVGLTLLSLIYMTRAFNVSRLFLGIFALIGLSIFSLERILVGKALKRPL